MWTQCAVLACTLCFPFAAAAGWHVEHGMNACNTPDEKGPCGSPHDAPGFHFIGSFDNETACASTCQAATSKLCPIWLWSAGSKHCWWRTDNVWNPTKQAGVVSGCRDGSDGHSVDCVPGCGSCPVPKPTPAPTPAPSPFLPTNASNMNGMYILSQTPGGDKTQERFPTNFKDYPRGVGYFDILTPQFSTLYSQVWWTALAPVDIPAEVVQRYAGGKSMMVVGFELDQVRVVDGKHVSVPMNAAYNHHFESTMVGGNAYHEKITLTGPHDPRIAEYGLNMMGHSMNMDEGTEHWVVKNAEGGEQPTKQSFGGANGGEVRKSFHGYAPGFGQVIKSPKKMQITPMQIDTWHREKMNLTVGSPFVAGPLPRNSLAAPDAKYSGLLECPITTRLRKDVQGGYTTVITGTCSNSSIATAGECFEAASKLLGTSTTQLNKTVSNSSIPVGCSAEASEKTDAVTIYFNKLSKSYAKCGSNVLKRAGTASSLVALSVVLDLSKKAAQITVTGPADVWFGVGFNASAMKDAPWAIVVDGHGSVTERKLADQNPGEELKASVTVLSASVSGGRRTVVLSRDMTGASSDYFSFGAGQDVLLPFINAVGSKATLSYHKDKTTSILALLPVASSSSTGACLCPENPAPFGKAKGTFSYQPTKQKGEAGRPTRIGFGNNCAPYPRTDLLDQKNPTCDIRTYTGGQIACHHMFSLLDADQDIPWPDQPLEYHLKMRFWYQDFDESYHHPTVKRTTWGIASPVEYDVPKCSENVKGCSKDEDGNWIHTIRGTFKGNGHLVAAHFHCHAPTCKSIKMYKDWNGTHGNLICEERPVYGGSGKVEPKFDEPGLILQPPCLWGSKEFGLEPPPYVGGTTTLHSIKTSYANSGHHGEMAWQQMYYVDSVRGDLPVFI